ncbi:hypothetical protein [Paenibacillus sp. 481]|uniref:hypothetical protein n=1 Tax=Paenibacillus sp. 481 TaxID=2835869 RepID=UPI001E2F28BA|nr:hypothetical protein [Paenibacillus sp. 481]UHA74430.1 hypothetical protein KIK04_04805 [Paenibacillus sp. 481]
MRGWIKIHRKIADNEMFKDPFYLKLWMLCLLKAAHKPFRQIIGNQATPLQAGQFVTGRKSLADDFNDGVSKKDQRSDATIWRMLQMLEREEMVIIHSFRSHSVITIANWHEYQDEDSEPAPPSQPARKGDPKKKPQYQEDDTYYKMAVYFRRKVDVMASDNGLKNLTKNANMQSWAKDFQLLVERDGIQDKQLILDVMNWVVTHEFWARNVLSAKTFRKQFPKLVLAMKASGKVGTAPQTLSTEERQQQQNYEDEFRKWVTEGNDPAGFRYDDTS